MVMVSPGVRFPVRPQIYMSFFDLLRQKFSIKKEIINRRCHSDK